MSVDDQLVTEREPSEAGQESQDKARILDDQDTRPPAVQYAESMGGQYRIPNPTRSVMEKAVERNAESAGQFCRATLPFPGDPGGLGPQVGILTSRRDVPAFDQFALAACSDTRAMGGFCNHGAYWFHLQKRGVELKGATERHYTGNRSVTKGVSADLGGGLTSAPHWPLFVDSLMLGAERRGGLRAKMDWQRPVRGCRNPWPRGSAVAGATGDRTQFSERQQPGFRPVNICSAGGRGRAEKALSGAVARHKSCCFPVEVDQCVQLLSGK